MESLPSELLVNIFERLDVVDAGKCRLVNNRFDQIVTNNWKKIEKPGCRLGFWISPDRTQYNLSIRCWKNPKFATCFNIDQEKIEVFGYKYKEFAVLLAKRLGVPDPTGDIGKLNRLVQHSEMNEALKVILEIVQLRNSIYTLEQEKVVYTDIMELIVNQLPKNSVQNLIFPNPKSSDEILSTLHKTGLRGIQYIRIQTRSSDVTKSTDMMDSLIAQIPMINLISGPYFASFSSVKTVIENWLHSDWVISMCDFKIPSSSVWRDSLISMNAEVESRERMCDITEVFRLTRGSDNHVLRIKVEYEEVRRRPARYDRIIFKLYENERYKDFSCIH